MHQNVGCIITVCKVYRTVLSETTSEAAGCASLVDGVISIDEYMAILRTLETHLSTLSTLQHCDMHVSTATLCVPVIPHMYLVCVSLSHKHKRFDYKTFATSTEERHRLYVCMCVSMHICISTLTSRKAQIVPSVFPQLLKTLYVCDVYVRVSSA
jgi:hypothetical protein